MAEGDERRLAMDGPALLAFLAEHFPQALAVGFTLERVEPQGVTLVLEAGDAHLRPGGTVMGPTLMMLADTVVYLAILSRVGPQALAVTTSLEMHFLRKAPPGRLVAVGRLAKLGRRLAVGTVSLRHEPDRGEPVEVGLATVTYSLPPG